MFTIMKNSFSVWNNYCFMFHLNTNSIATCTAEVKCNRLLVEKKGY